MATLWIDWVQVVNKLFISFVNGIALLWSHGNTNWRLFLTLIFPVSKMNDPSSTIAIDIGFGFISVANLNSEQVKSNLVSLLKAIGSSVNCSDVLSLDEPYNMKNSFLAKIKVNLPQTCNLERMREKMSTVMEDDGNAINKYLRKHLDYNSPYIASVDDEMNGLDPYVINVVIITISVAVIVAFSIYVFVMNKIEVSRRSAKIAQKKTNGKVVMSREIDDKLPIDNI